MAGDYCGSGGRLGHLCASDAVPDSVGVDERNEDTTIRHLHIIIAKPSAQLPFSNIMFLINKN